MAILSNEYRNSQSCFLDLFLHEEGGAMTLLPLRSTTDFGTDGSKIVHLFLILTKVRDKIILKI